MTAEQLEELLAMLDNGHTLDPGRAMDQLSNLAPSLARRVLAAEKLVETAERDMAAWPRHMVEDSELHRAAVAYREASK